MRILPNSKSYAALKEEVDKLISNGFIEKHIILAGWQVLVRKPNKDRLTCIDFSDLNKHAQKYRMLRQDHAILLGLTIQVFTNYPLRQLRQFLFEKKKKK